MNNFTKVIFLSAALCVSACNKSAPKSESLSEQLGALAPSAVVNPDNIPGNTDAEKLMYLLDIATVTKAATLIFLDGQIEVFESSGNKEQANELRENRKLLTQALDENIEIYVTDAAKVYEDFFTAEEMAAFVQIFSRPEMQKFTRSTVALQQKAIPVATAWSEQHVVPRYTELLGQRLGQ